MTKSAVYPFADLQTEALAGQSGDWLCLRLDADRRSGLLLTGETSSPLMQWDVFWQTPGARLPSHAFVRCYSQAVLPCASDCSRHLRGIDDWDMLVRIAGVVSGNDYGPACGYLSPADPTVEAGVTAQATRLYAAVRHQLQLFRLPRVLSAAKRQRRNTPAHRLSRGRYPALECSWTIAEKASALAAANI